MRQRKPLLFFSSFALFLFLGGLCSKVHGGQVCLDIPDNLLTYDKIEYNFDGSITISNLKILFDGKERLIASPNIRSSYEQNVIGACRLFKLRPRDKYTTVKIGKTNRPTATLDRTGALRWLGYDQRNYLHKITCR